MFKNIHVFVFLLFWINIQAAKPSVSKDELSLKDLISIPASFQSFAEKGFNDLSDKDWNSISSGCLQLQSKKSSLSTLMSILNKLIESKTVKKMDRLYLLVFLCQNEKTDSNSLVKELKDVLQKENWNEKDWIYLYKFLLNSHILVPQDVSTLTSKILENASNMKFIPYAYLDALMHSDLLKPNELFSTSVKFIKHNSLGANEWSKLITEFPEKERYSSPMVSLLFNSVNVKGEGFGTLLYVSREYISDKDMNRYIDHLIIHRDSKALKILFNHLKDLKSPTQDMVHSMARLMIFYNLIDSDSLDSFLFAYQKKRMNPSVLLILLRQILSKSVWNAEEWERLLMNLDGQFTLGLFDNFLLFDTFTGSTWLKLVWHFRRHP